jgi:predicted DNA-binding transcriptional regulator AlpA
VTSTKSVQSSAASGALQRVVGARRCEVPRPLPLPPPHADDEVFLSGNQTRAWVGGVSAMCIWRWMRDGRVQFPQPTKINGRNYWRLGDLRAWQEKHRTPDPEQAA